MTLDALESIDASGKIAMLTPAARAEFLAWCDKMSVVIDEAHLPALLETWSAWERPRLQPREDLR
jgi:hypothetical protein